MTASATPPTATQTLADRYIATQVEQYRLVFPATWVAEIIRIERSQILDLPVYDPLMLGIVNHKAQIMPLIAGARLLQPSAEFALKERLTAIGLSEAAGSLANVGIVVDRAIGMSTRAELPAALFDPAHTDSSTVMMSATLIPASLWQPRRWR